MAITDTQVAWTNMDTSNALTGYKRAVVWFSSGEIADLATLNSSYSISWGGTPVETSWSAHSFRDSRGTMRNAAPHPDGTVRCAVAEFSSSLAAGDATPTAPTQLATIVARSNTPPTADFSGTSPYGNLSIDVSYTDDENSTAYGPTDVLVEAFSANNNATHYDDEVGLRRLVFAEAYFGRGRHNAPTRTLGHNNLGTANGNPPVLVQGNIHALMDFEFMSGETWGILTLEFASDLMCPYPAEPPDDGAADSTSARHALTVPHNFARPTHLDFHYELPDGTPAPEELESPVVHDISNLNVNIHRDDAGTCHVYPMYMTDPSAGNGTGTWGNMQADGAGGWSLDIGGLGRSQGWACRFAISFKDDSGAEAEIIAKRYTSYFGMVEYFAGWKDIRRTGTFPYTGDLIDMPGWEVSIKRDMTEAKMKGSASSWFAGGETDYASFMNNNSTNPWDLLDADPWPQSGGPHKQCLWMREGNVYYAANTYRLYVEGGQALREYSARQSVIWQLDTTSSDFLYLDGAGHPDRSVQFGGGSHKKTSRHQMGLYTWTNSGDPSHYNGATRATANPDPNHGTYGYSFNPFDHEHYGSRPLFFWSMFSVDPWALRRLYHYGFVSLFNHHHRTPYGNQNAPDSNNARSEARIGRTATIQAFIASGDHTFGTAYADRIANYATSGHFLEWGPPIGKYTFSNRDIFDMYTCGYSGSMVRDFHTTPWQMNGIICPWLLLYAYEYGNSATANAKELAAASAAARIVRYWAELTIDYHTALSPANVTASGSMSSELDACWPTIIANNPLALQRGFAWSQLHSYDVSASTSPWNMVYSNVCRAPDPRGTGQTNQEYPILQFAELFASLRANTGYINRVRFLRQLLEIQDPGLANGDNHLDVEGPAWYNIRPDEPSVQNPPIVRFTVTPGSGERPLTVAFDASGSTVGGVAASAVYEWWWHSSDLTATADLSVTGASGQTTSHTYSEVGVYSPRLRITDDLGQTSDLILVGGVVVVPGHSQDPPVAVFTATPSSGTAPLAVTFDASGSTVGGTAALARYEWWNHYVEGLDPDTTITGATGQSHSFTYQAEGDYSPRLRITDDTGQQGVFEMRDGIHVDPLYSQDPPVPSFTVSPASGASPLLVYFDASDSVVNGVGASASYDWYFDEDEATATETIPGVSGQSWAYEYTDDGTYSPKLVITDDLSQTGTYVLANGVTAYTELPALPLLEFTVTPSSAASNEDVTVTLDDAIEVQVTSLTWEYRGPETSEAWTEWSTEENPPVLRISKEGTYDIRITAVGAFGTTTNTDLDILTITAATTTPTAAFTLSSYATDEGEVWISFSNTSTNYLYAIWDFGDKTSHHGSTPPTKKYEGPGTFTVTLFITDEHQQTDSTSVVLSMFDGFETVARYDLKTLTRKATWED